MPSAFAGKQSCESRVGAERDQVEVDQTRAHEGQGGEHPVRFLQVAALEHEHCARPVAPEVELAHHTRLMQLPRASGLCLEMRLIGIVRYASDFLLERQD